MNLNDKIKDIADTIKYKKQKHQDVSVIGIITLTLSIITFIMSYMNFIQSQYEMLIATIVLMLAFISIFALGFVTKSEKIIASLFCVLLSVLGIYFALTGGNDGFAILWSLLFPTFIILFVGFGYGIYIGVFLEVFFIILFWTPLNSIVSAYYSQTFMLRFPMLYTAFFVLSFLAKYYIIKMEIAEHKALFANKAKSEFLSRLSHEFRTPLNVILSMAKLGLNDKSLEESTERFKKIISSSSHLSDIINDVLDMSRIESGKTEIKRELMYLKQVIDVCLKLFELQIKEKNIALVSFIDATLPEALIGDEFRMRQVLINLLSNAVKFTEKGQVSLDVKVQKRESDKCLVLFEVADTGIGISENFLTKLFTPFEQEDSFFNRRHEGSGLGLSICHNLVELMGGRINVESRLGEGSRFTCAIPFDITETVVKKDENTASGEEISLKGKRILLVDDIEINRLIAYEVFAGTGVVLEEACDGEEAYRKFLQSPTKYYDCIIMDIQMPKLDGYATTGVIRESSRPDNNIPIIAMTANALKEDIDSAIAAGMNDHIAKPIDFDVCLKKTAQWCNTLR